MVVVDNRKLCAQRFGALDARQDPLCSLRHPSEILKSSYSRTFCFLFVFQKKIAERLFVGFGHLTLPFAHVKSKAAIAYNQR